MYYIDVCMLGKGVGLPRYFDGGVCGLKLLHSIHIKANSEKHIYNMKRYSIRKILFQSILTLIQSSIPIPHTGCKLINHLKGNKAMSAIMLVLYPGHIRR